MPREGVSYEQVVTAAEALLKEGQPPSIRLVRARLNGTGSPNTIHRHLSEWRVARAGTPEIAPVLPAAIAREIHLELARVANEARKDGDARLNEAVAELAELAQAGEALEEERDQLRAQILTLTRDKDVLNGKATEQGAELQRATQELQQARQTAEALRLELARGQLEVQAIRAQLDKQQPEVERLRARVRDEVRARADAEREQAASAAAKTMLNERLTDAQAREQTAHGVIADLRARIDTLGDEQRRGAAEHSHVLGELKAAQDVIKRGDEDVRRLREELAQARQEAASHARDLVVARNAAHASALEHARLLGRRDSLATSDRPARRGRAREEGLTADEQVAATFERHAADSASSEGTDA